MNETVETPAEPVTAPATETPIDYAQHEAAFMQHLQSKGMVVKPSADIQTEVNQAVRKAHEDWETRISEATGTPKPNGVKGLDWVSQVIKPAATSPAPEPAPAPNKVTDDVNASALKLVQKELADLRADQAKKEETIRAKKISLDLRAGSHDNLDAKDKDFEKKSALILNSLGKDYRWDLDAEDNAVPYDASGEVLINAATQRPYTPAELVKRDYAFLLPKEKPVVSGTGVQPSEPISKGTDGLPYVVAKTYEEISTKASELGLGHGTAERTGFIQRSQKASGIQ